MRRRAAARSVLLGLLLACIAPTADAHAEIAAVEPPSGARLDAAPATVRLELTQPVERSNLVLRVTDQDGRRVDQGDVQVRGDDRPVVTVSLDPDLPDGAYLITLTATSLTDSHRITYTRSFAVGGFVPFATHDATEDVDGEGAASRAVAYVGIALVLGSLMLGARLGWPARLVLPLRVGAGLHAAGAAWLLASTHAEAQQPWSVFLETSVGTVMAARAGLAAVLLLLALAMPARNGQRGAAVAVAALLAVIATARFTHASIRGPGAIANDVLHILAAGAWVGGLLVLIWLWLDPRRDAVVDARAFSTPALLAVIGIALTGVIATLLIVPAAVLRSPGALPASPYGAFLAGKVGLAIAMVAVAGVNRYVLLHRAPETRFAWLRRAADATGAAWLRPADTEGSQPRTGLRRLVGTEAALGIVVIILAGLLLSTSPPPAATDAPGGTRLAGEGDDFLVTATLDPAPEAGGASAMRFFVQYKPDHPDQPGQPVRNETCGGSACVQVALADANETVREDFVATPEGDGWWTTEPILWPRAGEFRLTVKVSTEFVFLDEVVFDVVVAD